MSRWIERLAERLKPTAIVPANDGRKRAAVAVVLDDSGDDVRVLLMKRVDRVGDPWSGHVSLPGGGFDARDRDLLATAIREAREELSIDLTASDVRLLGNLPLLSPLNAGPHGVEVAPYVFVTQHILELQPGPEAVAAFWLPLGAAASGALDSTYTYPATQHVFPSWRYEGYVIWGLTWRILSNLIELAAMSMTSTP